MPEGKFDREFLRGTLEATPEGRFGAFIYRLRLTWGTIQDLTGQWQGWASKPFRSLVGWYAPYFNAYTFVLARANEYEADATSARNPCGSTNRSIFVSA